METICSRCHQAVAAESCFCPACGLPQLVYSSEDSGGAVQAERGMGVVRDASTVEWKPALRAALILAVPAGLLSSGFSPVGLLGLFWMTAAAAWAVSIYVRRESRMWITPGAGARIGLITGLFAGWLAFTATGAGLFTERYLLHQSAEMDREWIAQVEASSQLTQKLMEQMGIFNQASFQQQKQFELTAEGHAGIALLTLAMGAGVLLLFAAAGGALGARITARSRHPEA